MLKGMRDYHMQSAGFSEIAQQITTYPDGLIAIGHRTFDMSPAGIKGANSTGVCMENIGNFDKGMDIMSAEQRETILFINAIFTIRFKLGVNSDSIIYHHWFDLNTGARIDYGGKVPTGSTKSCPGTGFFGGNTVDLARANFLPLVQAKVNEILKPIIKEVLTMFNDDAKIGAWAKPSVDRLVKLGLLKGDDANNFNPQNPLTREQFAVVIDRVLQLLGK
jgi:hypothetical protein